MDLIKELDTGVATWPLEVLQQKKKKNLCCVSTRSDASRRDDHQDRSDWLKITQAPEASWKATLLCTVHSPINVEVKNFLGT